MDIGADVMTGSAYPWGLTAASQAGAENVFNIPSGGIDSTLMRLSKASIHDLGPDGVLASANFTRCPADSRRFDPYNRYRSRLMRPDSK